MFWQFIQDEEGATSVEYALIAAIVSVAILGAVSLYANSVGGVFGRVDTELSTAVAP